jgi:hypothetical protein
LKRLLLIMVSCLVFSPGGLAQNTLVTAPAPKEDVEKLLQVMHSHDMMENMVVAMAKPMHQMVHDQFLRNQDKLPADFETRMNKLMDDMMKDMPFDEMMQAMVPSYQKHFTKDDIHSLITFYSSAIGQKLLREMPAIMGEGMQAMMPIMRQQMDAMHQRIQQEVADMLKNSQKKPE